MPDPQDAPHEPEAAPQQPPAKLTISPGSVTLRSGQAMVFTVSPPQQVTWSILPDDSYYGTFKNGVYNAPRSMIARGRSVVLQAVAAGEVATATVTLSSDPFWRNFIGIALLLLLIPIVFIAKHEWPVSCKCDYAPVVTPPFSWRSPGDSLQFDLVTCAPKPAVVFWKVASGPGSITDAGLYIAPAAAGSPAAPQDAIVQALDGNQKVIGSAVVHIAPDSRLDLSPPSITMVPGQRQTFTVSSADSAKPEWSTDPHIGELKQYDNNPRQWTYTAPSSLSKPALVRVIATAPPAAGTAVHRAAAAIVQFKPCDDNCGSEKKIFWFVFWMGVLGSYIHAAGSFASFAGNRTFVSSWTWWYFLRPMIGGLLAILVFFLFGGGIFGQGDISNAYLVASYAGLVGLFSEIALLKLKEIIETLFKPRDDRADKLKEGQADSSKPTISTITLDDAVTRRYAITGSGFVSGSRAKVSGAERPTTFISASKITFTLETNDTGILQVTVSSPLPDGTSQESAPVRLTV